MRRREFLVLSSAGAVGIATTGLASDLARATAFIPGAPRPYAIGYSSILPVTAAEAESAIGPVLPADALRHGDRDFAGGSARVTVHGFWRAAQGRNQPMSVALGAFYPLVDQTVAPLLAWSHSTPRATSLTIPLSADGTLMLDFQMRDPLPAPQLYGVSRRITDLMAGSRGNDKDPLLHAPVETRCRLSTGSEPGLLKLQRGTYVVAFRRSALSPVPAWSSLRLATEDGRLAREGSPLQRATALGLKPADDVDYLLFSVDRVNA